MDSNNFNNIFNPYHGKFVKKVPSNFTNDLFDQNNLEWRVFTSSLKQYLIQRAIDGIEIVAFYQRTYTNIFGLDIDDHTGTAWRGGIASYYLFDTYCSVVETLGFFPNILVKSPRGLHCYYVFDKKIPIKIMVGIIESRLFDLIQKKRVEIIPTASKALRIPHNKCYIHPTTFLSIDPPFKEDIDIIPINLLFNSSIRATISKEEKKKNRIIFKNLTKIEHFERKFVPIVSGDSNDALKYLGVVYRDGGLSLNQAIERFTTMVINKSPLYDGELKINPKRIKDRLGSLYKNKKTKKSIVPRCENYQYRLFDDLRIDKLMCLDFPFSAQRVRPIRYFLSELLRWVEWHDEIKNDPVMLTYMDYLYRWYRKNRKEGLFPLPSNYLKKLNSHYTTIIEWLEKIGFLIHTPYKYSSDLSICKYYRINWDLIGPIDG